MNTRFKPRFWLVVPKSSHHNRNVSDLLGGEDANEELDVPTTDGRKNGYRVESIETLRTIAQSTVARDVKVYRCFPHMQAAQEWRRQMVRLPRRARYSKPPPRRTPAKRKAVH